MFYVWEWDNGYWVSVEELDNVRDLLRKRFDSCCVNVVVDEGLMEVFFGGLDR